MGNYYFFATFKSYDYFSEENSDMFYQLSQLKCVSKINGINNQEDMALDVDPSSRSNPTGNELDQ